MQALASAGVLWLKPRPYSAGRGRNIRENIVLRRLFRRRGGSMPTYRPCSDERLVTLSPGGLDYERIARLERELGIVESEPEKPIRLARGVCLTKNCVGETTEIRTWSGMLAMRIHECERP